MDQLANQIKVAVPNVDVELHFWNDYTNVVQSIQYDKVPNKKFVLVGYSGGGSRSTWVANLIHGKVIDLMVTYDASPRWQMQFVHANVKKVLQYYNARPMMLGLGGGVVTPTSETTINEKITIKQQHLAVQFNQELHNKTIAAIKELE
jgi:hypothetical protein